MKNYGYTRQRWSGNDHIRELGQRDMELKDLRDQLVRDEGHMEDGDTVTLSSEPAKLLEQIGDEIDEIEKLSPRRPFGPDTGDQSTGRPSRLARNGSRKYRDLFCDGRGLSSDGWGSMQEYLSMIHSGLADPRLQTLAMSGVTGSAGGFAIPEEFASEMLDKSLESEIVRPRAEVHAMTSNTRKVSGWDSSDNSSSALFGGFTASWLGENESASDTDGKLRMIELVAKKLGIFTKTSNELLADAGAGGFEEMLAGALVQALGWSLDVAFLNGSGSGQPLGVLADPALIAVPKAGSQTADTSNDANLAAMYARMHPRCLGNSIWIGNNTIVPQLLNLSNTVQNGVITPQLQAVSGGNYNLYGRPLILTEKTPVLGDQGDLLLVDLSQYSVGLRKEISLEKSNAVNWAKDQTNFRSILRADGMGKWSGPFTPLNGDTLSWCVTLAERA